MATAPPWAREVGRYLIHLHVPVRDFKKKPDRALKPCVEASDTGGFDNVRYRTYTHKCRRTPIWLPVRGNLAIKVAGPLVPFANWKDRVWSPASLVADWHPSA
jgi:hypothetical protein